ncbi:MAG: SdrD B-like domain-containing protein, partial [Acidimicrobiales bacterium]
IEVVAPAGMTISTADLGGDDTIDSDIDGAGRAATSLTSGETDNTVDAGLHTPANVGDFIWDDLDGDGIQDAGEPGLNGITVNLLDATGTTTIATTTTTGGGNYNFTGLTPGDYIIEMIAPPGTVATTADAGSDDSTDSDIDAVGRRPLTLGSGDVDLTVDGGFTTPASVGDFVWNDLDGDGIQGAGEPGLDGITVNLLDATGTTTIATTTTTGGGNYNFSGLTPGDYVIDVDVPAGAAASPADQGVFDSLDSDVDPTGAVFITLASGDAPVTIDAGIFLLSTIAGTVFDDLDFNGTNDTEPGLGSITIELRDSGGSVINTTTTAADGTYSFDSVVPGIHSVAVDETSLPSGYVLSTASNTQAVTTTSGSAVTGVDFGYHQPDGPVITKDPATQNVAFGGTATFSITVDNPGAVDLTAVDVTDALSPDCDNTIGTLPAGGSVTWTCTFDPVGTNFTNVAEITASHPSGSIFTDSDDADVQVAAVAGTGITGVVFHDLDDDGGSQESGEPGLENVTVTLLDAGGAVIATTATDAGGGYSFDDLFDGSYTVSIDSTDPDLPASPRLTTANASQTIVVVGGSMSVAADVGYTSDTGSLAGTVVHDLDADGTRDSGEPGVAGFRILVTGAGPDGLFTTADDTNFSTTTDANGDWSVTDLPAGDYSIEVEVFASSAPHGLVDVTFDDDSVADGIMGATLLSGEDRTDLDAGVAGTAALGNLVFQDDDGDDIPDPDEEGVSGVTVTATWSGPDGVPGNTDDVSWTTTSDSTGTWEFTGLPSGTFTITIDTASLPTGLTGEPSLMFSISAGSITNGSLPLDPPVAPSNPGGPLALTGRSTLGLLGLAAALVLFGIILVVVAHRRREEEEPEFW